MFMSEVMIIFRLKQYLPTVKQSVKSRQVTIKSCEIRDSRFNVGSFIKYKLDGDEDYTVTPTVSKSLSPEFNHSRVVKIEKVITRLCSSGIFSLHVDIHNILDSSRT